MSKFELKTQALEPMFKKIEELDKIQRLAICVVTIGLLGAAFYFLSASPVLKSIKNYEMQYQNSEKKLQVAKQKAAKLVKLQNERKMKEAEFRKVMKALPEKREIPSLLTSISQSGQDTGIEFVEFEPKKEKNKDFYGEIPVSISMRGNYHNTIMFFDKVTSLNRIVNFRNIEMSLASKKGNEALQIKTKCEAVTFKFVDQTKQTEKKGKKRRKR